MFLPEQSSWTAEFLDQWTAFPAGAHDDMVDSSSQALSWLFHANGFASEEEEVRTQERDLWNVY